MSALRVLVDESLPRRLAAELSGLQVSTVREEGWLGLRNGVLLRAAVDRGFTVLVTADRSLEFQQNLAELRIAVVVLGGRNRLHDLRAHVPQLMKVLGTIGPGEVLRIGG